MWTRRALAVSMGDPAGIGLEIALKAWLRRRAAAAPPFFLIADRDAAERTAHSLGERVPFVDWGDAADDPDTLVLLHVPLAGAVEPGRSDPAHARAVVEAIEIGVRLALDGQALGLVTLPITKASLYLGGFSFPGHTEHIANLCGQAEAGAPNPVMMLAGETLRVALATIHTPLAQAPKAITRQSLARTALVVLHALREDFAIPEPRLAIAGLNPHAGEGGHLGREEIEIINPVAAELRAQGWDARDAAPADTLFHAEARARYDAALCMYHDQGLIPLKTLHFWDAVNVTLGLPIIRTSPDHGSGLDIAGRGIARPDSFEAALRLAAQLADNRARLCA